MIARARAVIALGGLALGAAGCGSPSPFLQPVGGDAGARRDATPIRIDLDELGASARLVLGPGGEVLARRVRVEDRGPGDFTWLGRIGGAGSAVLVVHGGEVTGLLRVGREVYEIVPLPGGRHQLVRLTLLRRPPDHPPRFTTIEGRPPGPVAPIDPTERREPPVVELLVAYTPAVLARRPDITAVIQLAIDEANEANRASGARFTLHLAATHALPDSEDPDLDTSLDWFATPGDGHFDTTEAARQAARADVAALVLDNQGAYLGEARAIMAEPATAFAAVDYRFMSADFVLAHELGHLMGLRHDPDADPRVDPFRDGHGYRHLEPEAAWETIMATGCGEACARIARWSNPMVPYDGKMSGVFFVCNEARVLTATSPTVSRFR